MVWTPFAQSHHRDPYPQGDGYDPYRLEQLLDCPEDKSLASRQVYRYLRDRLSKRKRAVLTLRREAERLLGRMMRIILRSLMLGRVDFRTVPYDRVVLAAFLHLYYKYLHHRLVAAYEDYVICGLGGISFSPFGIALLRPENTFAYPSFANPRWTARVFALELDHARRVFKRRLEPTMGDEKGETLNDLPSVLVVERMGPNWIDYHVSGELVQRIPRPAGHGHLLLTGDLRTTLLYETPRDLDEVRMAPGEVRAMVGDAPFAIRWNVERDPDALDLPIGLIEQVSGLEYQGYNLLAWHDIIIDAMLKRVQRGNVVAVRADLLDLTDEVTRSFLEFYKPIATMGGEAVSGSVQFLDVVPFDELKAMHVEVLSLFASVTGITHQMMQQVGVSDIASEVVAMQTQSNARINQLHQYVSQWVGRVADRFRLYLSTLSEESQEAIQVQVTPGGKEYETYGGSVTIGYGGDISYDALFESVRVEPTILGELAVVNRRNELVQALQVVAEAMPVLAQMGAGYDLSQIVDQILVTLNLDPSRMRLQLNAPAPPAGGPTPVS